MHITTFYELDRTLILYWGAILKAKITHIKQKIVKKKHKKLGTKYTVKRYSFCLTSAGNMRGGQLTFCAALCMSTNDGQCLMSMDFGVTNTF